MLAVPCQTEKRLPECVLSGTFDYGFKLGLMAKDVRPPTFTDHNHNKRTRHLILKGNPSHPL